MPAETTSQLVCSSDLRGDGAGLALLLVLDSPDAVRVGQSFPLDQPLTLGRRSSLEIEVGFEDRQMSRRHATLRPTRSVVEVCDLDSKNGSRLDGKLVSRAEVTPPAILRFGNTLCALECAEPEVTAAMRHETIRGDASALRRMLLSLHRVAPTELSVLLQGETGTGKDLAARHLHRLSGRTGRFVAVNCAAVPVELAESHFFGHRRGAFTGAHAARQGSFLEADGGTLFLDEIGELPATLQPKLLRALESGQVTPVGADAPVACSPRIVAATNSDLAAEVAAGSFRADLYARLAELVVRTPPLRQRRADILPLARHLSEACGRRLRFSPNAAEALVLRDWPLNVRGLKATVARLVLAEPRDSLVRSAHLEGALPPALAPAPVEAAVGRAAEPARARSSRSQAPARDELVELLRRHGGSISALATHYQRHRKQIHRWLRHREIDPQDFG